MDEVRWVDLCDMGMGVEDLVVISHLMLVNPHVTALDLSFNKIAGDNGAVRTLSLRLKSTVAGVGGDARCNVSASD
jgi:hypothetical protein